MNWTAIEQLLSMLRDAFIFCYMQGNRDTGEAQAGDLLLKEAARH
jgi:hypothetical protein